MWGYIIIILLILSEAYLEGMKTFFYFSEGNFLPSVRSLPRRNEN